MSHTPTRFARPQRSDAAIIVAALAAAMLSAALPVWLAPARATSTAATLDPGEDRPGGAATSRRGREGANAFSHNSGNLGNEGEFRFKLGNGLFRKLWVSSPSSTRSSDGLGPLYNTRGCQRCHLKDGRGHTPAGPDDDAVSMLVRVAVPGDGATMRPDPVYGGQIQDFAIQGHRPEARIAIGYQDVAVTLAGGEVATLRRPTLRLTGLAYGPLHPQAALSPRIANPMIGLGLLEAIDQADVLAAADPDDADGDGISGRANRVVDRATGTMTLGRFGWKASQPTVRQQSAAAFAGDIGLSTTLFPAGYGDCTTDQQACRAATDGADPDNGNVEVTDKMLDLVEFYARNLAVPPRPAAGDADVLAGKQLFAATGCTACHRPDFTTSAAGTVPPAQRGQHIWPYTDLLLHDLGEELADGVQEGEAQGREWRTAPLWGIGATQAVSGHTQFLHDGRARNLTEAILWHGGEAEAARNAFVTLSPDERASLLAFLNSL